MPVGIPKNERICITRTTKKGEVYYITQKEKEDDFFLYKLENGKANKIAKGVSPQLSEEKYIKE